MKSCSEIRKLIALPLVCVCEACRRRDSDTIMLHPGPPMADKVALGWEGPARVVTRCSNASRRCWHAARCHGAIVQYAQAGSRGRDAVLTPRDWQQSAARVSTRSIASAVAVMAQQAQQQRPCPAPSAPPERSAGVRDAIPVGVINCALVASLCGPQMALLALRCRCSRGAARRARAAVLSQYAIATHSLWEGAHFYRIPPGSHAGVRCCSECHSVVAATRALLGVPEASAAS